MFSSKDTPYDPGLFEVTIGVLLSLSLGALLACVFLMSRPVERVRELPAEPKTGTVYYIEGSADSTSGRLWQGKREQFVDRQPGELALIEDELNSWARATFKDVPAEKDQSSALPVLKISTPNFRIQENVLQIVLEGNLQVYGTENKVVIQIRGEVQPSGEGHRFVPSEVWVGGLEASKIPGAGAFVANRMLSSFVLPEELTTAWNSLDYAKVEGRQLVLRMR
ncbi:MAG: hypothetical protein ABII82_17200 [Verrucomicrobiota bacterium]